MVSPENGCVKHRPRSYGVGLVWAGLDFAHQDDRILLELMPRIASRVSQLNGEGALAVFSRAKELEREGRSIIHLELGEPDFHPAAPIVDSLRNAVAAGRDRYCATRGIPALREAIADYLS